MPLPLPPCEYCDTEMELLPNDQSRIYILWCPKDGSILTNNDGTVDFRSPINIDEFPRST